MGNLEICRFRDFFGYEYLENIFLCGLIYAGIFLGIQNNLKICGSAHRSHAYTAALDMIRNYGDMTKIAEISSTNAKVKFGRPSVVIITMR